MRLMKKRVLYGTSANTSGAGSICVRSGLNVIFKHLGLKVKNYDEDLTLEESCILRIQNTANKETLTLVRGAPERLSTKNKCIFNKCLLKHIIV